MSELPWGDAQLFLGIVRAGSIRGAARGLRVDASTVSRRLAALEQSLGVRLVDRTKGRLSLTKAGQQLAESGERVDGELSALARSIAQTDRAVGGVVNLTVPGSLSPWAARAIAVLARTQPAIEVQLLTHDALFDVDGLSIDVAVRVADAPPTTLVGQRIGTLGAAVYASRALLAQHGGRVELASKRWVEWDRRLAQKPSFRWLDERYANRSIAARGLSTFDVHQLIQSGVGVGALPCVVGDPDPALRRLDDLPGEHASSIWLLAHPELSRVPRVRHVMSVLRKVLTEARETLAGERRPSDARRSVR